MKIQNLLKNLTLRNTADAIDFSAEFLSNSFSITKTKLGSLIAEKEGIGEKIMLEAHIDEIGFVVTHIDENGFIKLNPYGGVDARVMPASEVLIFGEKEVVGIVASTPPHLLNDDENKVTKISDLVIDVGTDVKYISLGDFAIAKPKFYELKNNLVSAPSLDNRAGVAVLLRCAELLNETDRGFSIALCVAEEVNGSGAATAAFSENPDIAIAVDVSFAKAPSIPPEKCGKLGGGPMIGISPVLDREISQKLCELANEKSINYSKEIMGATTGTDADHISKTRCGIKTGLVSVPLRNMHTASEIVSVDDIEACAQLIAEFILSGGIANA